VYSIAVLALLVAGWVLLKRRRSGQSV
jgi:hypothetical protein